MYREHFASGPTEPDEVGIVRADYEGVPLHRVVEEALKIISAHLFHIVIGILLEKSRIHSVNKLIGAPTQVEFSGEQVVLAWPRPYPKSASWLKPYQRRLPLTDFAPYRTAFAAPFAY